MVPALGDGGYDAHVSQTSPSQGGASTVRQARAALEAQDTRAHAARIARLAPVPLFGWLAFLPIDFGLTGIMYPESMWACVGVRLGVGAVLLGLFILIRKRPPKTTGGIDLLVGALMVVLAGAIGVIAAFCGGISSVHGAGAMIVMAAPSFVELPWQRGARVAFAAWIGFIAAMLVTQGSRGQLADELANKVQYIAFAGYVLLLVAMGTISVIGGHLGHRLRQQVYETRSIGKYRLQRLLGKGGMGEVWAAYHQGLRRDVALKILRDAGPQSVSRFEREVQALADLRHPNTVRVFDYGSTDDGLLYYAMELLVGVDLAELVKKTGPLAPARAVHLMLQASRALGEAHQKGMVHRDVKPENLFIAVAGGEVDFVKLLDFGIVRLEEESETLTQQGHIAGTPAFMAPEVGRGADANARSDVYALGAVLYYLLTGSPPFEAKGTAAILAAHQNQPVVPPSLRMEVPLAPDVEAVVMACLSKDPEARPANASALADALTKTGAATDYTPALGTPSPEAVAAMPSNPSASQVESGDQQTRRLTPPAKQA